MERSGTLHLEISSDAIAPDPMVVTLFSHLTEVLEVKSKRILNLMKSTLKTIVAQKVKKKHSFEVKKKLFHKK